MGGGASKSVPLTGGTSPTKKRRSIVDREEEQFTSLEVELLKPEDGSDVTTPRSAQAEVKRLRKMIYSESKRAIHASKETSTSAGDKQVVENTLLYGHADGHQGIATEDARVEHIDDFDERRTRKKDMNVKMRKLKRDLNHSARDILEMMKVTHVLAELVATSVSKVSKGTVVKNGDDPASHVQNLIHSDYHDREVAVLVSDLRGFTSTTRKYGIVHFASIIVRMRQLVLPIFTKYNALNITTEADNFITIFPDASSAVSAALEMQQILLKYNASLSEDRQHYKVRLNGIGVGCGEGVLLDNEGKLHGTPSNEAYHIGEDVCENGIVLMTSLVEERIKEDTRLSTEGATIIEDFKSEEDGQTYKQITVGTLPMEAELVSTTDMRYLAPQLGLFAERHNPEADVQKIDKEIADKFKSNFTALMYHLDLETGAEKYGANQSIVLKSISLSIVRPIFHQYHAIELEDELFIFYETSDAVLAALAAKDAIKHYNELLTEEQQKNALDIHGWGIHGGTMIFVEGTDIHWGDPVNTASKLGQDLATGGDLLISKSVYETAQHHHKLCDGAVIFESRLLKRSGVDFPAFCCTMGDALKVVKEEVKEEVVNVVE